MNHKMPRNGRALSSPLEIREESLSFLDMYCQISIAFNVSSILFPPNADCNLSSLLQSERKLETSYLKNYDQLPGNSPSDWPKRFDMTEWLLFSVRIGNKAVGAAAIAS